MFSKHSGQALLSIKPVSGPSHGNMKWGTPKLISNIFGVEHPKVVIPSSCQSDFDEKSDLKSSVDSVEGNAFLNFKTLSFSFSKATFIESVQFKTSTNPFPKDLLFIFYSTKKEEVCCRFLNDDYQAFDLPIQISGVVKCNVQCLCQKSGNESTFKLDGVRFIMGNDPSQISVIKPISPPPEKMLFPAKPIKEGDECEPIIPYTSPKLVVRAFREEDGSFLPGSTRVTLYECIEGNSRVSFSNIQVPFAFPQNLSSIFICSNGFRRQPKELVLNFHNVTGEIITKIFTFEKQYGYYWFELYVDVDSVIKSEIECLSSWDGDSYCQIDSLQFALAEQDAARQSLIHADKQSERDERTVRVRFDREELFSWSSPSSFTHVVDSEHYIDVSRLSGTFAGLSDIDMLSKCVNQLYFLSFYSLFIPFVHSQDIKGVRLFIDSAKNSPLKSSHYIDVSRLSGTFAGLSDIDMLSKCVNQLYFLSFYSLFIPFVHSQDIKGVRLFIDSAKNSPKHMDVNVTTSIGVTMKKEFSVDSSFDHGWLFLPIDVKEVVSFEISSVDSIKGTKWSVIGGLKVVVDHDQSIMESFQVQKLSELYRLFSQYCSLWQMPAIANE
ncbi:hypothetical protein ADUPG1_000037 [Aduncisulcus paluster]|uniref:Uncharacterized protein n=1 Tax=Aduncisulcus paluster TaxID=2918883 RepID=A0ABQ5K4C9_9EUKA|nr:hypothetical protein ADUPG1_000037 [Aduncisulcus paluster]